MRLRRLWGVLLIAALACAAPLRYESREITPDWGLRCPVCTAPAVEIGYMVVWVLGEETAPDTEIKGVDLPIYWCPSCGCLFSLAGQMLPDEAKPNLGRKG